MLRPERMSECTLLVPKSDARRAVHVLADLKALHIQDHDPKRKINNHTIDLGLPDEGASDLATDLIKTRALLSAIGKDAAAVAPETNTHTLQESAARVRAIAERVAEHERIITETTVELNAVKKREQLLTILPPFEGDIRALTGSKTTKAILITNTDRPEVRAAVALEQTVLERFNGKHTALLIVRRQDLEAASNHLKSSGAAIADLTPLANEKGTLTGAQANVHQQISVLERTIEKERNGIASIASQAPFLRATEHDLSFALLKAQAHLHFGATQRVEIVRGWIPTKDTQKLTTKLDAHNIRYVADIADAHEDAPILLHNPRPTRGFEALLSMYSLPRYNEIDPTSIMAITFPIFFGFMLGDIGYGLVLLALTCIVARTKPALKPFAEIVGISAVSSVLFGLAFGEVFGLEQIATYELPHLLHRGADPQTVGLIALAFGVLHVNLGLLLSTITASREHGVVYGLLHKGGWFAVEAAVVLAFLGHGWPWGLLAFGLGVIAIGWGEGLVGIVELPTLVTHTLSYLRLAAIGLASVYLALVVNIIGGGLVAGGGIGIIAGVLILLLGHTINLALGLLDPFLHSLRLHYAEFFLKFYEGGGVPYKPFGTPETTV